MCLPTFHHSRTLPQMLMSEMFEVILCSVKSTHVGILNDCRVFDHLPKFDSNVYHFPSNGFQVLNNLGAFLEIFYRNSNNFTAQCVTQYPLVLV